MERVNKILENRQYLEYVNKNRVHELDRKYCKHDLNHFFDVARIAYILNLEKNLNIDKEIIYAAALLHDIGKWKQYSEGVPHHISSSLLCVELLKRCDFSQDEIDNIKEAVYNHRNSTIKEDRTLSGILYQADKLSRKCFDCITQEECNWSYEKKNLYIKY